MEAGLQFKTDKQWELTEAGKQYAEVQRGGHFEYPTNGGGSEIRTQGGLLTLAGFQDRCFKPLSQPT